MLITSRGHILAHRIECHLNQAAGDPSVVLTCDENLVGCYDIRVEDGTLVVDTKDNVMFRTKVKSYVTVSSPSLKGVSVSGSGNCRVTSSLASDADIVFKGTGSGRVDSKNLTVGI